MAYEVSKEHLRFLSADGKTQLNATIWAPVAEGSPCEETVPAGAVDAAAAVVPRGVIQIVHGMSEYHDRYDEIARFFCSQGYAFCGHDHIGHGFSVESADDLGVMPRKDSDRILVEDVHGLRQLVQERWPEVPYIVFGHSMGSFITRAYLGVHAEGLAGAIICGTGHNPSAVAKAGRTLAKLITATRGNAHKSNLLHGMADGAYGKAVPNARTPLDWLNTDDACVDAYIADPLCGFMFSASAYVALMKLLVTVADPRTAAACPAELPLLFVAGEQDPVGACGEGVRQAAALYAETGHANLQVKLYPGMRHEIHNEPERNQVYSDSLTWIEAI